jgi:hypothetical protein
LTCWLGLLNIFALGGLDWFGVTDLLGRRIFRRLLVVDGGESIGVSAFAPSLLKRFGIEDLGGSSGSFLGELKVEEAARGFCWITELFVPTFEALPPSWGCGVNGLCWEFGVDGLG